MASKTTEEMNEHRNPRTTLGTANVSETGLNDRLLSAAVTRESAPTGRRPGDRAPAARCCVGDRASSVAAGERG